MLIDRSSLLRKALVDLSERDNKETLFVKKGVETNDAEVSEEVVVKVAREL